MAKQGWLICIQLSLLVVYLKFGVAFDWQVKYTDICLDVDGQWLHVNLKIQFCSCFIDGNNKSFKTKKITKPLVYSHSYSYLH